LKFTTCVTHSTRKLRLAYKIPAVDPNIKLLANNKTLQSLPGQNTRLAGLVPLIWAIVGLHTQLLALLYYSVDLGTDGL
jgi:hypothetical protein